MKAKKNKKLKGMTLIECIIAMVVLAITGLIMVRIGTITNRLLINTNHLNNKTQAEAKIGSVKDKGTLDDYCDSNSVYKSNGEQEVTFSVGSYGNVTAKRYDTKAADEDAETSGKNCKTNLDDGVSLQFYDDFS